MLIKKFLRIFLIGITFILFIGFIKNYNEIYADYVYKYEPCVNAAASQPSPQPTIAATQNPYPILQQTEPLTNAYPGSAVRTAPTVPLISCTCRSDWESTDLKLLTLQYPKEAVMRLNGEGITLSIPNCHGSHHPGFIIIETKENSESRSLENTVIQGIYNNASDVRYREITVDGIEGIEVYRTRFSNSRRIYLLHQSHLITISLNLNSGHMAMPDADGNFSGPEPKPEAIAFFYLILDSINFKR